MKRKSCTECGRPVWKAGKCLYHTEKVGLRKAAGYKFSFRQKVDRSAEKIMMFEFFLQMWDERCDGKGFCYCYETGRPLAKEIFRNDSRCYHHILPKQIYPQYLLCRENIVILHPSTHSQVETNISFTPKVEELTYELKQKHLYGHLTC